MNLEVVPDTNLGYGKMSKRISFVAFLMVAMGYVNVDGFASNIPEAICVQMSPAPNDGTYTRTNYAVTIYTESGHCKGTFAIYLHGGRRYIAFYNTWICIQGKSRFAYNGNWYVIK